MCRADPQPLLYPLVKVPDTHGRQRNHLLAVASNASNDGGTCQLGRGLGVPASQREQAIALRSPL